MRRMLLSKFYSVTDTTKNRHDVSQIITPSLLHMFTQSVQMSQFGYKTLQLALAQPC